MRTSHCVAATGMIFLLTSLNAQGGEKGIFLNFGLVTGGKLSSSLSNISGEETANSSLVGSGGITYGLEGYFQGDGILGVSTLLEVTPYKNIVGSADWQYLIAAMPRAQFLVTDGLRFWGGIGLGIAITGFGNYRPFSVSYESKSGTGIGISPRVGMDYDLGEGNFLGLQVAFVKTTASVNAESSSGTPYSVSFDRNWWSVGLRLGKSF